LRFVSLVRTFAGVLRAQPLIGKGALRPSILDERCQLALRCDLGAAEADDAVLVGEHDQLGAVADLELGEEAADVGLKFEATSRRRLARDEL
jgi:hypothetical protein